MCILRTCTYCSDTWRLYADVCTAIAFHSVQRVAYVKAHHIIHTTYRHAKAEYMSLLLDDARRTCVVLVGTMPLVGSVLFEQCHRVDANGKLRPLRMDVFACYKYLPFIYKYARKGRLRSMNSYALLWRTGRYKAIDSILYSIPVNIHSKVSYSSESRMKIEYIHQPFGWWF